MASPSASSIQKRFKYDVFLSFRGEDTCKTFVDHLYHALNQRGIITYKDDEKIKKGKRIDDQLITSIEDSRFHIIVFSKNYASSSWCLDELVKIMECQKTTEQTAYLVCYDVEPTEIRKQSGAVGEALAKHGEKEAVGRWRDALTEAAKLSGCAVTMSGHEAEVIKLIVEHISPEIGSINLNDDDKLVGMETRVKNIVSSLEIDADDVRMIGIKGMGGSGKTTLARAVFDQISIKFEGKSFVENVREASKGSLSGLKELQEQVLKDVLNDQGIAVDSVTAGKSMMERMMRSKKVLVVLDDVDDMAQLEALAGEHSWFGLGSRIIITTRDEQVLVAHQANFIHDVNLLSNEEAIRLFSRYAFRREIPIQRYEKLSKAIVTYAAGLPLTIKVMGSHLWGRSEHEWIDAIKRLETIPLKETSEKLELSYDGLENDQKEIFLDVACILKGATKERAIKILESCGFRAQTGLRVLEQKSLLTISADDRLQLHDHIEEMGMNIVRRLHPDEPNRHTRLWVTEEIEDIFVNDLGTEATRSIKLSNTNLNPNIIMNGLTKMKYLRFLYVDNEYTTGVYALPSSNNYLSLPNALRYLYWRNYPLPCLPKAFQANNLVNLEMPHSNISLLWEEGERKVLNKLRFLDLAFSRLRTFDLGLTPNLEELNLEGCYEFVELHIPSECPKLKCLNLGATKVRYLNLGLTPNLEELNLRGCYAFIELHIPAECLKLKYLDLGGSKVNNFNLGLTPNLEELHLEGCNKFVELHMPVECPKLKYLNLGATEVRYLNLGLTPNLEKLNLRGCDEFVELHMPSECPKLKYLNLGATEVRYLNLGLTPNLEKLNLRGCYAVIELHIPAECLKLKYLDLGRSKVNNFNLGLTPNLEELNLKGCCEFVELHMPSECPKLKYLNLRCSKVRYLNLGLTPNLKTLDLGGCENFVELHMPFECPKLKYLNLSGSKLSNVNLGLTPNLEILDLEKCNDLVDLYIPIECPKLKFLDLSGSKVSNLNLRLTPRLERLDLTNCCHLQEIHAPAGHFVVDKRITPLGLESLSKLELTAEFIDKCPLHPNSNMPKFRFKCKFDEPLPSSSGNLEKLISFGLCACTNLKSLSESICYLQQLGKLTLEGSMPEVPKNLNKLESLEELSLSMEKIKQLPDSICMLKHLKSLELKSCLLLKRLPNDLGSLEGLEKLHVTDCISLQEIPSSICEMKCLKYLHLPYCVLLGKLPDEVGRLECLEELNIEGTSIYHLPDSIFQLKDLCVVWSRGRLESYGFTSLKKLSKYTASCYIRQGPTTRDSSKPEGMIHK